MNGVAKNRVCKSCECNNELGPLRETASEVSAHEWKCFSSIIYPKNKTTAREGALEFTFERRGSLPC